MAYRVAYHSAYLGEVPLALGTFSDGSVYEAMALDIRSNPPLGTEPFYLQGLYGYVLALGMLVRPWIPLALLLQLALAGVGLWLFHRAATRAWGARVGLVCTLALLAHPPLAFYENKYLSASLGIVCNAAVLHAFVVGLGRADPKPRSWMWLGAASGLAVLARGNMLLALPFTAMGVVALTRRAGTSWRRPMAWVTLGFALSLAPMAARNAVVTGAPDTQPVHGGGTSFYIGNNPKARGLWNDAGLLSARVGAERAELLEALGMESTGSVRDDARAIGGVLYGRGLTWIKDNPGDWLVLQGRKTWLMIGNEELTQDYDLYGERELLPWAWPIGLGFGVFLALGILGAATPRETEGEDGVGRVALGWLLAGQLVAVVAANLVFFTSAQHRLPLVLPLAFMTGPALEGLRGAVVTRTLPRRGVVLLSALALAQAWVPRSKRRTPHPVHYYNLAVVQDEIGDPLAALKSYERAVELRPNHPMFRFRRGLIRHRLGNFPGSIEDLEVVLANPKIPSWLRADAEKALFFAREAIRKAHVKAGLPTTTRSNPP